MKLLRNGGKVAVTIICKLPKTFSVVMFSRMLLQLQLITFDYNFTKQNKKQKNSNSILRTCECKWWIPTEVKNGHEGEGWSGGAFAYHVY